MDNYHIPVLLNEVVFHFKNVKGLIVDGTLGAGGHSIELLKQGHQVFGIDNDPEMLVIAVNNIKDAGLIKNFDFTEGNFSDLKRILRDRKVSGILLDLGISGKHYLNDHRGFSFLNLDDPLDMRLNKNQGVKASDLLNVLRKDQLEEMLETVYLPFEARKIVKAIIEKRNLGYKFEKVSDLLIVTEKVLKITGKTNPATKLFLALRIAVNSEYQNLIKVLNDGFDLLESEGVMQIITFHSGEDRIVKNFFKEKKAQNLGEMLDKISPSAMEIGINARSRSALLRILIKKI